MSLLISRLFLTRAIEGKGSVSSHLSNFKKRIFGNDMVFSFENFINRSNQDLQYIENLKEHLIILIGKMGGKVVKDRILANVWLFYEDNDYAKN